MKLLLLISLAAMVLLCWRVIELEKYRYAASLNMCSEYSIDLVKRDLCLKSKETRTHWLWHLYYGVKG